MIDEPVTVSGGCQCGAVRYRAELQAESAHICHCRMCQKAVGNAFASLVGAERAKVEWTRGEPTIFMSSDLVARGFCNQCGTPLTYDYIAGERINVIIGSLDDPSALPPRMQFGVEGELPWFNHLHSLNREGATEETMPSVVGKIRGSNHQHPDHDTENQ